MTLPEQVGVMVLPQTVFFPHHLLPLRIFEPRYREMLAKALEGSRMFAVALEQTGQPTSRVGGLGLIRSCVTQPDGTSNLILQGLTRGRLNHLVQVRPLRLRKFAASPKPNRPPWWNIPSSPPPKETIFYRFWLFSPMGCLPCESRA